MDSPENSQQLFARWQNGDSNAADDLFNKYVERLIAFAHVQMSPQLRQREDEEDVVQSVYRSFFIRSREGQFNLERSGDLWRLLAAITINKIRSKAEFHGAAKRRISQEARGTTDQNAGLLDFLTSAEPSPTHFLSLQEELGRVLETLPGHHRQMLELRLQGESVGEIAIEAGRSEHQVRRVLHKVEQQLAARLLETSDNATQAE